MISAGRAAVVGVGSGGARAGGTQGLVNFAISFLPVAKEFQKASNSFRCCECWKNLEEAGVGSDSLPPCGT